MNYDQCVLFAKKIRLEFPRVEILMPNKTRFFCLPPRNLFIYSRNITSSLGSFNEITLYFIADSNLTKDEFIVADLLPKGDLIFRQIYFMNDEINLILNKLEEVCPHYSFEKLYIGYALHNQNPIFRQAYGDDLIVFLIKHILYFIMLAYKRESRLVIDEQEIAAYGFDLLLLIKDYTLNTMIEEGSKFSEISENVKTRLQINNTGYQETFGVELVDFIHSCCKKTIKETRIYVQNLVKIMPEISDCYSISVEKIVKMADQDLFDRHTWVLK